MVIEALSRLGKNTLIFGVSASLQKIISLLLLPFYTRALTPGEYGVASLVSIVGIAMSGLLTLGTGNSMGLLYFRESDTTKRPTIIWSNVVLMILNGIFWYVLIFLLAPFLSNLIFQTVLFADLIRISMAGSVLLTIGDPFMAYLRMNEKAKTYVVIMIVSSLITIGLSTWFVLFLELGVFGLIFAGTISQGLLLFMAWFFVGRKIQFKVDTSFFKPLVRIGLPSIFGLFGWLIIDYSDRQMIERMVGLDALGVYSIAYSFGMTVSVLVGAFATAWPPFFASFINKQEEARVVFSKVLTYYLVGFGSLVVLYFYIAKPLVVLMTTPPFHEAYSVIGLVAGGYALKGVYLIMLPGISFAEKLYKQSVIIWIVSVSNIIMNYYLLPVFGIFGAAIATFFSFVLLAWFTQIASQKYLALKFEHKRILTTLSLVVLVNGLLLFLSYLIANMILLALLNTVILGAFLYLGYQYLLQDAERKYLYRIWNEGITRIKA